jgi:hypothetical protein
MGRPAQSRFRPHDPNFEKHFDLPPNIDLNADPEPTLSDLSSRAEAAAVAAAVEGLALDDDPDRGRAAEPPSDSTLKAHGFSRAAEGSHFCNPEPTSARGAVCDGFPVQAELERGCSPDRVPVSEDQLRELNMTHWEKLEFSSTN